MTEPQFRVSAHAIARYRERVRPGWSWERIREALWTERAHWYPTPKVSASGIRVYRHRGTPRYRLQVRECFGTPHEAITILGEHDRASMPEENRR